MKTGRHQWYDIGLFICFCSSYEQIPASVRLQMIVIMEKKPKLKAATAEKAKAK